ncbi:hypothetical protein [Streptomyces chryseus]|uniref:hypothetical protein n=1 Tax=Streptomyces chryseus TaxID=68186 RepID=UPI00110FAFA8|nr:hypothetical protein [Streptomyces chryseus]GGX39317.1 hypothetical protein GCM10010353_63430 [Streptomyces chryseus]
MSTQVYDALGFDPAPGTPALVRRLVTILSKVGNQLNDAHGTLTRLGKSEGIWEGEAAAGFAKKVGELPKYLRDGHGSLMDAASALHKWDVQLTDFQTLASRYEADAEAARHTLKQAQSNPDLKLAGQTFDTDAALLDAQERLNHAAQRVNEATRTLNGIINTAHELIEEHAAAARAVADVIRRAAERAPDLPGLFDRLKDALEGLGDKLRIVAGLIHQWLKDHADLIYKIGDWLGYASAACDVLAILTSETLIGAVVFEAIGIVLNGWALAFHAGGWALGAEKGSWLDIGLDIVGFVPFGDLVRVGKVGVGAFTGVKIPMEVIDFGARASDAWKRADDIIDSVGGTARYGEVGEKWVMRNMTDLGQKARAIHITADNFTDRLGVAVARHFGDANLYKAGAGISDIGFQKMMPELIENTPLRHIPTIAGSVKPVIDDSGEVVGKYIDPRSWPARGYEAALGSTNLAKEGIRMVTEDVQYLSDKVHGAADGARDTAGRVVDDIRNVFG